MRKPLRRRQLKRQEVTREVVQHVPDSDALAELESELTGFGDTVEEDHDLANPMILVEGFNAKVLMSWRHETQVAPRPEVDVDTASDLDDDEEQDIMGRMDTYRRRFKESLWETILPALAGWQFASTEINAELRALFDGQAPVSLDRHLRSLTDVITVASIRQISAIMGVNDADTALILRSRFDEQAQRSRPNARPDAGRSVTARSDSASTPVGRNWPKI